MKIFSILVTTLFLCVGAVAEASQLVTQEATSLKNAKYVILGKVMFTSFDQKKFTGFMQVDVLDILRGKVAAKSLKFPVDKNPMSGFDVLLNKGDIAVFFISEVKDGEASLIAPGAGAVFSKEYFK